MTARTHWDTSASNKNSNNGSLAAAYHMPLGVEQNAPTYLWQCLKFEPIETFS
jgi:hypothetical protein